MLAYSSIAHTGYILAGLAAFAAATTRRSQPQGIEAILFYVLGYGVMNIAAFAVVGMLQRDPRRFGGLGQLRGPGGSRSRARRGDGGAAPLSLTGIPPTVGFFAKLYVLPPRSTPGLVWLAVAIVLNAALAAFYYLRVIVYMYMREPEADPAPIDEHRASARSRLALSVGGVLALGVFPEPIVNSCGLRRQPLLAMVAARLGSRCSGLLAGSAASACSGDRRLLDRHQPRPGDLHGRRATASCGRGAAAAASSPRSSQVGRHVPVTWVAAAHVRGRPARARRPAAHRRAPCDGEMRLRFATVERAVSTRPPTTSSPTRCCGSCSTRCGTCPTRPMIDAGTMRAWTQRLRAGQRGRRAGRAAPRSAPDREPRIMLHDYHLYLAAATIRARRPEAVLSHFTHIPWPPSSIWQVIAPAIREGDRRRPCWRNDVVGFQTARYAHNFLRTAETFLPGARGRLPVRDGHPGRRARRPRAARIRSASTRRRPGGWRRRPRAPAPRRAAARRRPRPDHRPRRPARAVEEHPARLRGLRDAAPAQPALSRHGSRSWPSSSRRAPACASTAHYAREVQAAIDRINARFSRAGYRPIQLFSRTTTPRRWPALAIADVVLVNPLVDGMNLVAKEAAIVSRRDAAIVLSETAGAHDQMADGVLPVAPADVVGTADALRDAIEMPEQERALRLERLRVGVEREDITWWLRHQLSDLAEIVERR